MNAAEIRNALRGEPWLEPFIEDDDDLDEVRERFEAAQAEALRQLAADAVTFQRRYVKTSGLLTTCLAPDSNRTEEVGPR